MLLLAASLAGCKKPVQRGSIGETLVQTRYQLTVVSVKVCPVDPAQAIYKGGKDRIVLDIELIVESTGRGTVAYVPGYAQVIDSTGASYGPSPLDFCARSSNDLVYLEKGKPLRVTLPFSVPEKAHGLKLNYSTLEQAVEVDLGT